MKIPFTQKKFANSIPGLAWGGGGGALGWSEIKNIAKSKKGYLLNYGYGPTINIFTLGLAAHSVSCLPGGKIPPKFMKWPYFEN